MDGKLYQTVRYDFPEPDQIYRRAHRADVDYLRRYLYERYPEGGVYRLEDYRLLHGDDGLCRSYRSHIRQYL